MNEEKSFIEECRCCNCESLFYDDKKEVYRCKLRTTGDLLSDEKEIVNKPLAQHCSLFSRTDTPLKIEAKKKLPIILLKNYMQNAESFYLEQPFFYDDSGLFWFWKDNKYELTDEVNLMNMLDEVLGFMGQTVSSSVKSNYMEAFRRVGRKKKPKDAPKKWIQFKHKAFSLKSDKTYNVTPDYFFTNPIPWDIGETDETPIMDKLITEWVGDKYLKTAYEIIAYCCLAEYPIHLIFCLVGSGRNGKSKFLGLIHKFIGKDNICSTELDVLLDSRFESFKLFKKLVCSMGETNFGVLKKTSILKKLTGQDLIGFEFKNKKPFDDYNYAKIIISSNSLPVSEDTSEGFYRRWLILDFPNTFKEGKDILQTIPEVEYSNLAKKVTKILPKLLKDGSFTNQGTIKERMQRYIMASNPLSYFLENYCEKDHSRFIRYGELYNIYRQYLNYIKKRRVNHKEFQDVLALEGLYVYRTSKQIGQNWVNDRFIEGIELKYGTDMPFVTTSSLHTCSMRAKRESEVHVSQETQGENVEELIDLIHVKCSVCGAEPSKLYYKGRYFCTETCLNQFKAQCKG